MSTSAKPSERIAIIGAGSIGAAWAIVFAAAGFRVHLAWRDRALMALLRCRRGVAALEEMGP